MSTSTSSTTDSSSSDEEVTLTKQEVKRPLKDVNFSSLNLKNLNFNQIKREQTKSVLNQQFVFPTKGQLDKTELQNKVDEKTKQIKNKKEHLEIELEFEAEGEKKCMN